MASACRRHIHPGHGLVTHLEGWAGGGCGVVASTPVYRCIGRESLPRSYNRDGREDSGGAQGGDKVEAKEQIRMLADETCSHSSVQTLALVWNLKTKLSVATVKGNALVFQSCIGQLARKTGEAFQKGATRPHTEVG